MSLQLWRPLITNKLTQPFGANLACVRNDGKIVAKRGGTCPVNSKEFYPTIGMKGHNGLDYSAWSGEPIFHCANFAGKIKTEVDSMGGIGVDVISLKPVTVKFQEGTRYTTYKGYIKCRYWHLKAPVGHDGKVVKLGDTIGLADNTGASSGDHLHFGIKKCDKYGNATEKGNGYYGAFDPWPFMNNDTDAKSAAEYLNVPPLPLSAQERKEMLSQLSILSQLLNALLELKRKL